jgi:dihydroorotase
MKSILIHSGHLIDPAQGIDRPMDLLLRNGRIAQIAEPGAIARKGHELINAQGLVVSPGFIDIHVHLREPGQQHKETIATGTAAAAAGGFTSVCTMPNTVPVNDSVAITRWLRQPARGAVVNVFPIAAATIGSMGEKPADFVALHAAGAVAFSDDGKPVSGPELVRKSLRASKKLGVPFIQHSEDTAISNACAVHSGPTAFRLGLRGSPPEAESNIVMRDIEIARETGGHLHVAHVSARKSLDAIRKAKKSGVSVTCEVTPHHFTLLDEHIGSYDTNFKMCPPLRSAHDRDAMLRGLLDGTIDCIATDHAPHARHEKLQEFDRAPNGITGLETALGITVQVLHHHKRAPLRRIVELLSTNPARIIGLQGRGTLAKGAYADITIFDPNARWTFSSADSQSKSKNTPFDGWQLTGKVVHTIVGGKRL